jgi:hypothetical protein
MSVSLIPVCDNMKLMICGLSHTDMECTVYLQQLAISSSAAIGSLLLILLVNLLIALTLTALDRSMSWFARPVWIFFLYICPTLFVPMALLLIVSRWQRSVSNQHAAECKVSLSVVLCAMLYVSALPEICPVLASIV